MNTTPPPHEPAIMTQAVNLHEQAVAAYQAHNAAQALALFRDAVALLEQAGEAAAFDLPAVLGDLGQVLEERCAYADALACYEQAAARMAALAACGDDSDDIAALRLQTWHNLSRMRRLLGQYEQAEPLLRCALAFAETRFGHDSLQTAGALNDLGMWGKFTARFEEAAAWYGRALAILAQHGESDGLTAASLYHNLGGLEHARGCCAAGEPYARQGVTLRERLLPPDHPDIAADLVALAALLDGQAKFAESVPLYLRALAIFRHTYGDEHYEIAATLHNLAAVYQAQQRDADAEALYRQALALKRQLFPVDNADIALTLSNLGVLYQSQGRDAEANALLHQALAIVATTLPAEHPQVRACREALGLEVAA